MKALLTLIAVIAAVVLVEGLTSSPAAADCSSVVTSGESSFDSGFTCPEETPAQSDGQDSVQSSGASTTYSYDPACVRGEGISGTDHYGCGDRMTCGEDGHLYFVWAHYPDGTTANLGSQCFEPDEAPAAQAVTAEAVLRAFERIPVPASEVVIQPPGGETLVNLDTVFSTEAEPFRRTIGLLGHRVELDIWASEFRWVNGDGTVLVTDWAGRAWSKGAKVGELITHRYDEARRGLRPRVDTTWSARYRVDGGPWRDVGGTVTITGDPHDLAVLSAEPKLAG